MENLKLFEMVSNENDISAIVAPALVLNRTHLSAHCEGIDIEFLGIQHFSGGIRKHLISPLVLFVDDDGKSKLLKNRFGNDGMIR